MRTPGTRRWQLITHLIALIALALGQIVGSTVAPTGVAYAAAPEINVQPLTASFGAQEVGGTSAAQTVTIQNTGDAALSVSGISLGGADAGMFAAGGTCGSTFPLTVVAGGSCTVLLTFHPTSMGARSASLTLASDDGDEPAVAVALSGTGVDTTPPAAPVISSPAAGSSTSITIPTFRGTAEPGSTVTIIDGSTTLCSAVTDAGGVWACAPSTPMAPGNHSVSASAVDAASNTSPASPSVAFTIDTTPPNTAITIKPFNPSDSTNATIEFTGSDNLTAAGSLTFECQLDVVTWTSCSSPATYTSLSQGSHTFRVRARDAAGSVDTTPASYTWVVDTVPPAMPTIGTPAITSDRTPMIIGTAEPSSALVVELDLNSNGAADITYSVTSDGSGSWTIDTATAVPVIGGFPGAGLMDGSIQLSATVYDSAGNPSTTATATLTVDTTAPAAPVISSPAVGSATNDTTPTFSGTAEANSTITITEGLATLCTATANSGGAWTCSPVTPLADGGHTVAATAADAIGNISVASPGRTFAVDTAAPNAPVVIGPLAGSATSDTTPTFNGTAEVGSTVAVKDGLTTICTATTNGSGAWSCTPGVALSVGSHTVAATASDAAGNISAASPDRTFTVDTAAPSTPVASSPAAGGTISDTTPTFSGMAEAGSAITVTDGLATLCAATTSAGGNWSCTPTMPLSEGGHTVAIIASDAAGNSSTPASHSFTVDTSAPSTPSMTNLAPASITNDTTPAISGVADVGSTITLVLDPDNDPSTTDSVTYTTTVAANGTWSIDTATVTPTSGTFPASGLAEGTVGLSVIATDLANNTSAPLTQTFTIDIIAPAAPSITGPTAGSTTRDSTPTISGTAEANSTITVTEGLTALCTITADATGAWSCAPSVALSDGNHTIRATATDAAGNTSPVSPHRAFMIDTSAPSAPVVSSPAAGSAASDATPTFSGTAEPGSTVTVVEGTTTLCTATADGAGMWSCAPITPLSAGDHSITVIVTDPAGNTGPASDPRTVTIDTSTAIAPTITSPTPGSTTTDPTPTFSGTGEPGSSATMNEGTTVLCVATADSNGDWSCTPTAPLANGYHDITVVVTDPHGATILTAALPITVVGPLKLYYMPLIR